MNNINAFIPDANLIQNIQDMPLVEIVQLILVVSTSILALLSGLDASLVVAIGDSGIMIAELMQIEFMPDLFDINDEDLPAGYFNWHEGIYGPDDWHITPDTVEIRDTLLDAPGPIDNLATVIEQHYNNLIERFNNFSSFIETAIGEFRFRSPMLNIEDSSYIRQLLNPMEIINDRVREISSTLNNMMRRIEINSSFWFNHPALHASFERAHSNSGLLLNALSNLYQSSVTGIDFLNNLLNDLDSRHIDRERNL